MDKRANNNNANFSEKTANVSFYSTQFPQNLERDRLSKILLFLR